MRNLNLVILIMLICIPLVSAYDNCNISNISLTSGQITDTSFKLFWNTSCATYVGIYQNNVLLTSGYTLNQSIFSELRSNTPYSIMLTNGTCAYIKEVTTKMTSIQTINYYLNALLFFFLSIGLLILAITFRSKIISGLGVIIMVYGLVNSINNVTNYQINIIYGIGVLFQIIFLIAV